MARFELRISGVESNYSFIGLKWHLDQLRLTPEIIGFISILRQFKDPFRTSRLLSLNVDCLGCPQLYSIYTNAELRAK